MLAATISSPKLARRRASSAAAAPSAAAAAPSSRDAPGDPPSAAARRARVTSTRSPTRSVTATSAPGGTGSRFTATETTEENSAARAFPGPPRLARSTSDSRAPRGTSTTRMRPSTTATTVTTSDGGKKAPFPSRLPGKLAESADTRLEKRARAPPRPIRWLSSWFAHSGLCVGNGHGHGTSSHKALAASSASAASTNASARRAARAASCASRPCHESAKRAQRTCSSMNARRSSFWRAFSSFSVFSSMFSLYLQWLASPYSAAACISGVRICTSHERPRASVVTACRDRYPLGLARAT